VSTHLELNVSLLLSQPQVGQRVGYNTVLILVLYCILDLREESVSTHLELNVSLLLSQPQVGQRVDHKAVQVQLHVVVLQALGHLVYSISDKIIKIPYKILYMFFLYISSNIISRVKTLSTSEISWFPISCG
jgi:hypothetical protein